MREAAKTSTGEGMFLKQRGPSSRSRVEPISPAARLVVAVSSSCPASAAAATRAATLTVPPHQSFARLSAGPVLKADVDRRQRGLGVAVLLKIESEAHAGGGVAGMDHDRVTERLDHLRAVA